MCLRRDNKNVQGHYYKQKCIQWHTAPTDAFHTYRGEGHAIVEIAEDRHGDRTRNLAELDHIHQEKDYVHHHKVAAHDRDEELEGRREWEKGGVRGACQALIPEIVFFPLRCPPSTLARPREIRHTIVMS